MCMWGIFFSMCFVTTKLKVFQASEREILFIFSNRLQSIASVFCAARRKHKWILYNMIYLYFFSSWRSWHEFCFWASRIQRFDECYFAQKQNCILMFIRKFLSLQYYVFLIYYHHHYYYIVIIFTPLV